jgi:hypothetical protein
MSKEKEEEERILEEPLADDDEGNSRRGMLKRIGLTAAALAALGLTSSTASAQGERRPTDKPPSEQEILVALRKQGITNLQQLARAVGTGNAAMSWIIWVKGKFLYKDDAK